MLDATASSDPQSGTDLNGASADGVVNVNFGQSWQLDPNAAVGSGGFDFYGVVFHEFTHALGFLTTIQPDRHEPVQRQPLGYLRRQQRLDHRQRRQRQRRQNLQRHRSRHHAGHRLHRRALAA